MLYCIQSDHSYIDVRLLFRSCQAKWVPVIIVLNFPDNFLSSQQFWNCVNTWQMLPHQLGLSHLSEFDFLTSTLSVLLLRLLPLQQSKL